LNPISSSLRVAAQLVAIVGVLAAVAVHFYQATPRPPNPAQPSVVAEQVVDRAGGSRIDVSLRVASGSAPLGPIAVFFMVGIPGDPRPWEAPRYVAPARLLPELTADAPKTVSWTDLALDLPPANYEVTGWIHAVRPDGTTEHVAGGPVGHFTVTEPIPQAVQFLSGDAFNRAIGPLELETIAISQPAPADQVVSVTARIHNRGGAPVGGRTQVVISRFVDPEPFRTALWQTDWATIRTLAPGEAETVAWQFEVGLPAGTYGLSVWVHARADATFEHSHATFNIPLKLETSVDHVQRTRPPAGDVEVSSAQAGPGPLRLMLTTKGRERAVAVGIAIVPEERRFDWARTPLSVGDATLRLTLRPNATAEIATTATIDCATHDRLAHVAVFGNEDGPAAAPIDDVLIDVCP
jgi:hypothetical protein